MKDTPHPFVLNDIAAVCELAESPVLSSGFFVPRPSIVRRLDNDGDAQCQRQLLLQ